MAAVLLVATCAQAASVDIDVIALFSGAALLDVNGNRQMLRQGDTSAEGVVLVSADSSEAVIELNGERRTLNLTNRIGTEFKSPELQRVSISLNDNGQYRTGGSINGRPVLFLVDTGANVVAMNSNDARDLGLDLAGGQNAQSVTAGGVIRSWEVNLDVVQVGEIKVHNVKAAVLDGEFPEQILLGMTFLSNVEISESAGVMVLTSKF